MDPSLEKIASDWLAEQVVYYGVSRFDLMTEAQIEEEYERCQRLREELTHRMNETYGRAGYPYYDEWRTW